MATITSIARIVDTRATTTALALGGAQITTGHAGGIAAVVETQGHTLHVTRLEGEADWTVDALYKGSLPIFCNGEGARYLRTKQVADETIVAQLDAAAVGL